MTTPQLPWGGTDPDDLPQGVVTPGQLGSTLQNPSAAKYRSLAAGRFPSQVNGTAAGNPANVGGPLGFVVNLFAQFAENVATADPADIQKPEDLHGLIESFFEDLPVIGFFIELKDAMQGTYDGDDPVMLFIQALFAPIRRVLQIFTGRPGGVNAEPAEVDSFWDDMKSTLKGEDTAGEWFEDVSIAVASGVQDLADNIRNAVQGGVAAGTGAIAEAFEAVSNLFGIADNAEKIAMAAQQQLQDITNETNTPGWSGYSWSTIFSGADGTPLPSTDWATTRIAIVGDDGHAGILNNSTDGEHFCTVRDIHQFQTDSQSASIVVGKKWSFSDDRWTSIRLRCDDDDNPTQGAVCWVRPGNVRIGRFSGGANTYWNTISQSIKSGDIVRFRCHGDNYYVLVNGVTVVSWTDVGGSVLKGAGFRHAAFAQEYLNGAFFDQASFQVASWAMADWVPAGGAVTTPSWRFRRSSAGFASLAVSGGAMAAVPSGFFSVSDLASAVTVTNLGLGQVTITESGFYRLHLTAQATVDVDRGTPHVPCVWGVYVDSNLVSGAVVGETEVYLAAGQVVSPRIFAGWPATMSTASTSSTALTLSNVKGLLEQTSTIDAIGGPSAAWTGRKVA